MAAATAAVAPGGLDPRAFRQGMRALPGAVTILACEDGQHGCCGLTATAVCSFSAEPPSLLACVNRSSSFAGLLGDGSAFSVNLPAADQEHVARAFGGMTMARGAARFSAGSWVRGDSGAPLLAGARAVFDCTVGEIIPRASHLIVIGLVRAIVLGGDDRAALFYSGGRFVAAAG